MKDRSHRSRPHHSSTAQLRQPDLKADAAHSVPGLTVRPSPLHGLGCFATQHFRKGRKIAEYAGLRVRFDDLTEDEAWTVLQAVEDDHDANLGICWDVLEYHATCLFGPETDHS